MSLKVYHSGIIGFALVTCISILPACHGENTTTETSTTSNTNETADIDFETLSLFGVSHEFVEQFRLNLLKAIEAAKDEVDPLRQGEFGGVSGGFFQGGGGAGGGGGGSGTGGAGGSNAGGGATQEEDEEEEDDTSQGPVTPGPGPFGVLSGIFGIFSGLGTLNPSRIIQSTVNFFPPSQRMQAQMIVDALIGYVPPENRTAGPRPRTRRPATTPMVITDMMMKEATDAPDVVTDSTLKGNVTLILPKDGETGGDEGSNDTSVDLADVVMAAPTKPTTEGFINLHELLNRSTTPAPLQNEDDEDDFEKNQRFNTTVKPKSNSSLAVYKLTGKSPENGVEIRGVNEEDETTTLSMKLNGTSSSTLSALSLPSSSSTTPAI